MSDAHPHAHGGPSDKGRIKTPAQLITTMAVAFGLPLLVIIMLTRYVEMGGSGSTAGLDPQSVALRIEPVGQLHIKLASAAGGYQTGEQTYTAVCSACHAAGVLGAPKFGDEAAWAPRIKTGYDNLLHSALNGKNSMPARGGSQLSDYEIARAVVYMADKGGAKFEEPKPPADAASAAPATAAEAASTPMAAAPAASAP
jgi:cytochrome c5